VVHFKYHFSLCWRQLPCDQCVRFGRVIPPVPPWKEQKTIAHFLDHETAKIDTLIHEQKRLIELLKEKRQAVISHAVTKGLDPDVPMKDSGVKWLGEVPAHWQLKRLKQVTSQIIDGAHFTPRTLILVSHLFESKISNQPKLIWKRLSESQKTNTLN